MSLAQLLAALVLVLAVAAGRQFARTRHQVHLGLLIAVLGFGITLLPPLLGVARRLTPVIAGAGIAVAAIGMVVARRGIPPS